MNHPKPKDKLLELRLPCVQLDYANPAMPRIKWMVPDTAV